jgi:hypothetical protein
MPGVEAYDLERLRAQLQLLAKTALGDSAAAAARTVPAAQSRAARRLRGDGAGRGGVGR